MSVRKQLGLQLMGTMLVALTAIPAPASNVNIWQRVYTTIPIRDLAASPTGFVAAGANGIWVSSNLTNWQLVNLPNGIGRPISIVTYANGHFLAGSNGIVTSPDGINWTLAYSDPTVHPGVPSITYAGGVYVAADNNINGASVLRSTDGENWAVEDTGLDNSGNTTYHLSTVNFGNGLFVAAGQEFSTNGTQDVIITSSDGINWTRQNLPNSGSDQFIDGGDVPSGDYGIGLFVEGGIFGFYTSPDGVNWAAQTFPNAAWVVYHIAFVNGEFVGAGLDYSFYPLVEAAVFTSPDGTNWTAQDIAPHRSSGLDLSSVRYRSGHFILSGYLGAWTSTDASNWNQVFSGPQSNGFECLGYGGGNYLLLPFFDNPNALLLTSTDGTNWPDTLADAGAPIGGGLGPGCVAYGSGRFVAGGLNQQTQLYYSSDGVVWTPAGVPADADFGPVVSNGTQFLSLGGYNNGTGIVAAEYGSANGTNWTQVSPSGLPGGDLSGYHLKYVNDGFFAWNGNQIYESADGTSWTQASVPGAFVRVDDIAYGAGKFIATGGDSNSNLLVASSVDGLTWQQESGLPSDLIEPNGDPAFMTFGGGEFLIGAMDSLAGLSAYLVSHNGLNWTENVQPDNWFLQQIVWDGTKFVSPSFYDIFNAPGVKLDMAGQVRPIINGGVHLKYTFQLGNDSADGTAANNAVFSDPLPAHVAFESASASQGSCSQSSGTVNCNLGDLGAGAAALVTVRVRVTQLVCSISNTAASYAEEPVRDDATPSATVTVTNPHC